jgi:hypothetical protein
MVKDYVTKYAHLLPQEFVGYAICGAFSHDVQEDTRQTYNDVKEVCGLEVAEISYALANEKGKNRKERANHIYYKGIRECYDGLATFVKICDRLANVKYSTSKGSGMASGYAKEMHNFRTELFDVRFKEMFDELYQMTGYDNIFKPSGIVIGKTYYWKRINHLEGNGIVTVKNLSSTNRGNAFEVYREGNDFTEHAYQSDLYNY